MLHTILIVLFASLVQAILSTVLSILFALPLAHFFYRFNFFGKRLFIALATMLCIMPTKMIVLCVNLFYGSYGTGFTGIVLAHLLLNIPFTLYILHTTYQKIDTTLIWLAADSGATPWQCYKDIIFPLIRPTLVSIALLLFLLHFASFSIPLLLGGALHHNTPEIMMYNFYSQKNYMLSFIFWLVRLAVIIPLFFMHNRYAQQQAKAGSEPNPVRKATYSLQTIRNYSLLWPLYFVFIGSVIFGPLLALVIRACDTKIFIFFKSIFSFIIDPILGVCVYRVILNSIVLAILSGIGAVLFGFLLAAIENTMTSKFGRSVISLITVLAFIIGSVGVGILFAGLSSIKSAPIALPAKGLIIAILCHIILNYAFAYRIIRAQMVLYHADLHKSAQTLGATYKKAIWTVALPFVFPALLRAFCVSFGLSLTEVGAGTVLAGKIGLTMPMAIRIYRKCGNQEAVIGLSLILLGLVLVVTYLFSYEKK